MILLYFRYPIKGNLVAVVTDGSAVLGLGNIGPRAAMPVMEGKAALFRRFAGIDAIPICLDTQDTEEIIATQFRLGGGNLCPTIEDAAAVTDHQLTYPQPMEHSGDGSASASRPWAPGALTSPTKSTTS